jgi:hypothetical protein
MKKEIKPTLSQEEYQKLLTHPKWQKRRLEIMQRDNWMCTKCHDTETTLHVHHIEYHNGLRPWEYEDKDLSTLCEHCHLEIELLKKSEKNLSFDNISIFKYAPPEFTPKRLIAVRSNGTCSLILYGEDDKRMAHIPIGNKHIIKSIIKLLDECMEWNNLNLNNNTKP